MGPSRTPPLTPPGALKELEVLFHEAGELRQARDQVTVEVDLEVGMGERRRALTAYPHELARLALGHAAIEWCGPGERPEALGAADGLHGFRAVERTLPEAPPLPELEAERVGPLMDAFLSAPGLWEKTGCFHRMALYDPTAGDFACRVEDIGRHNCVDRLMGWALESGADPRGLVLFVSARATASLVAKIAVLGPRLLVSRAAVTTGGIERARAAAMTLVGFARQGRFTVYCSEGGRLRV